jgi:antitoxin HicB
MSAIVRPRDYEIAIRPLTAAEGGGFGATVPELPGCMSDGETPQEALDNVYDAIACWVEAAQEMGRPLPAEACEGLDPPRACSGRGTARSAVEG